MATANALKNFNRTQQQKRVRDVQETSDESIIEVLFAIIYFACRLKQVQKIILVMNRSLHR